MRGRAAKLGLCFAEKINICRSLLMIRSHSKLAAGAEVTKKIGFEGMKPASEKELKLKKDKSLYLCFTEYNRGGDEVSFSQVVRPINLSLILDDGDDKEKLFPEAACIRSKVNSPYCSLPNRFGSQIVFPTGENNSLSHFSCCDTSTKKVWKTCRFESPKNSPLLGYLHGKFYKCNGYGDFELSSGLPYPWVPLKPLPIVLPYSRTCSDLEASFLEDINKILVWERKKAGVYCFDTSNSVIGNEWTDSFYDLAKSLPFIEFEYGRPPVFFRDYHPIFGTFYLMFNYDIMHSIVTPFSMSVIYQSFHSNKPLHLPKLCDEYFDYKDFTDFEFVHLGDHRACLVLNKFFSYDHNPSHLRGKGILLLITFKYEIIITVSETKYPTAHIQTQFLRVRRFQYHNVPLSIHTTTESVRMTGVFLQ